MQKGRDKFSEIDDKADSLLEKCPFGEEEKCCRENVTIAGR